MTDELHPATVEALLSPDSPTVSLQAEIDRQAQRIAALETRVARLERDRHVLRERLEAATKPRRGRRRDTGDTPDPTPVGPAPGVIGPFPPFEIPEPTPPASAPKIGAVLDEFSRTAWGFEAPLVHLHADRWRAQLETDPVDMLFVESAWSGPGGSWSRRVARFGDPDPTLVELTSFARSQGIPTVFWNKEDPANFAWFAASAALFDHVFTVDGDAIPTYRERLGHDRIHVLPFAAQPAIHHPVPTIERVRPVAFTGSYYAKKHAERRRQMEFVLVPALDFGLEIWDRHAGTADPRFRYPHSLTEAIQGSLTYAETLTAHHHYQVFLNVNSVARSTTMCARRVFELLACGTPIISGPSRAVERLFGDVVALTTSSGETRELLGALLTDASVREQTATAGMNALRLGQHTYADRLREILSVVGH